MKTTEEAMHPRRYKVWWPEQGESKDAALDLPAGAMDDETHWVWDEALSAIEFTNA